MRTQEKMTSKSQLSAADIHLSRPLVLVGLMGAGKSTIGRRLASALSLSFVDADQEIVEVSKPFALQKP